MAKRGCAPPVWGRPAEEARGLGRGQGGGTARSGTGTPATLWDRLRRTRPALHQQGTLGPRLDDDSQRGLVHGKPRQLSAEGLAGFPCVWSWAPTSARRPPGSAGRPGTARPRRLWDFGTAPPGGRRDARGADRSPGTSDRLEMPEDGKAKETPLAPGHRIGAQGRSHPGAGVAGAKPAGFSSVAARAHAVGHPALSPVTGSSPSARRTGWRPSATASRKDQVALEDTKDAPARRRTSRRSRPSWTSSGTSQGGPRPPAEVPAHGRPDAGSGRGGPRQVHQGARLGGPRLGSVRGSLPTRMPARRLRARV